MFWLNQYVGMTCDRYCYTFIQNFTIKKILLDFYNLAIIYRICLV